MGQVELLYSQYRDGYLKSLSVLLYFVLNNVYLVIEWPKKINNEINNVAWCTFRGPPSSSLEYVLVIY